MRRAAKERKPEAGALAVENLLDLGARNLRMIAVVTLACVGASCLWLSRKPPVYRATASLILDDSARSSGVLGELAALTKAPQASSEMELLRARTTAEEAVAAPKRSADGSIAPHERERHLGLTTLVDDPDLKPLARLFCGAGSSRDRSRLLATLDARGEPGELDALEVEFLEHDRVRIRPAGVTGSIGLAGVDALETRFQRGAPILYAGLELRLEPQGDLTGRAFVVRSLSTESAVQRVMRSTRVRETERNSGVIQLVYDDSDPQRAADTANALCRNYLARNKTRGERRASQTLEFISTQLASQMEALDRAQDEVVELQKKNPRAIDVGKAGEALIGELSKLEVERVEAQLMQVALRQALDLARRGEFEALSRLSPELADPITASYVESVAQLTAEYELQDRSDAGAYKALLQQRALELETELDRGGVAIHTLAETRDAVASRSAQAIARLGAGPALRDDPLLAGYLETLAELESQLSTLAREFTAEHPDRVAKQRELDETRARMVALLDHRLEGLRAAAAEHERLLANYRERTEGYPSDERNRIQAAIDGLRGRAVAHLSSRLQGIEAAHQSLAEAITAKKDDLGSLPEEERVLADPMRRFSAHSEIVKFLLSRQQEAEITRASTIATAEFIDPAVAPTRLHGPSVMLHVLAGVAVGLGAALALAFVKESMSRGVFTAAELETVSGLPVFGTIPDFRHGRMKVRGAGDDFVPLRDDPEGPTAEAYRSLRANLKFAFSGEREIKSIAATSCSQGEGKSMTNIALALAFALNDKRVILVDADMRRPSVHKYLGLALAPGLSDVLEGRSSWRECAHRNVLAGLDVLCAGRQPRSPGDLLDSAACARLIEELEREYDLVVFDVPPALAVADIENLAARLDGLLLVARSNKIAAHVVAAAAQRLQQAGAHLLGAVLNGVGSSIASGRYGYGYGLGYGYGSTDRERGREPVASSRDA